MIEASNSITRYRIVNGPEWQRSDDWCGKKLIFPVMKDYLKDNHSVWREALEEPGTLEVLVDCVAAPLAMVEKPVRGTIIQTLSEGVNTHSSDDVIGLGFLKRGQEVEIDYNIIHRSGILKFSALKPPEDRLSVLMLQTDVWRYEKVLSFLEASPSTWDDGRYYEVSNYATRKLECALDSIKCVGDLQRYATLNPKGKGWSNVDWMADEKSLLRRNCKKITLVN